MLCSYRAIGLTFSTKLPTNQLTMFDYNEQIQHGVPFSLNDGLVTDSAILSPHNSFYEDNEYYTVTVTFADSGYVDEIERLFTENSDKDLPDHNPWRIDKYTIKCDSLIKPKTNGIETELEPWGLYDIRVKTQCSVGNEAVNNQVLLVMISSIEDLVMDEDPTGSEYF